MIVLSPTQTSDERVMGYALPIDASRRGNRTGSEPSVFESAHTHSRAVTFYALPNVSAAFSFSRFILKSPSCFYLIAYLTLGLHTVVDM